MIINLLPCCPGQQKLMKEIKLINKKQIKYKGRIFLLLIKVELESMPFCFSPKLCKCFVEIDRVDCL